MTFDEIKQIDLLGKQVLILGRPGAGKTWLSNQLAPYDPDILHTDEYLPFGEQRAIQCLIECAPISGFFPTVRIIEGMLGYKLLLQGFQEKSYYPDIIIECIISRGRQRELYLKERNPENIKHLEHFHKKCMLCLNEYLKLASPEVRPQYIEFNNLF